MPRYTELTSYSMELDKLCKEKNFNNISTIILKEWYSYILSFYESSADILNHSNIEEYIKYNFEKLKKIENIKIFEIEELLINVIVY